ncbi:MAG: hypothetical protein SV765_18985 [Pseudomonadota bacterium]|nr:hypothetical protein [Pseudomonadota bacterium]
MTKSFLASAAIALMLALAGCANTVKYDESIAGGTTRTQTDDGTISNAVNSMLEAMLADSQVQAATRSARPMLAVFGLINFTYDPVDLAAVNSQLMNTLSETNHFRFADQAAMTAASEQWKDNLYQLFEQPASGQQLAQAVDADYLLVGEISNLIRTEPKTKKVFYRVGLKLLDANSGEFLWQGKRELLKSEKDIIYGI